MSRQTFKATSIDFKVRIVIGVLLTLLPLALSVAVYSDNRFGDRNEEDNTSNLVRDIGSNLPPNIASNAPRTLSQHESDLNDASRIDANGKVEGKVEGNAATSKANSKVDEKGQKGGNEKGGMAWLAELNQSPLTPPPYVFGVVWTTLYLLMGAALALFVDRAFEMRSQTVSGAKSRVKSKVKWMFFGLGLILFVSQLTTNYTYLRVMFVGHDVRGGMTILYALLALFAGTCVTFAPVSPLAAALLCPCAAYLVYAAVLQSYLVANNDTKDDASPDDRRTIESYH
jgi:benzodiazapine receptor